MDTAKLLMLLFLLLMVSLLIYIAESVNDHHVLGAEKMTILCIEKERQALLRFKQGFTDYEGVLGSWDDEDCCKWDGIRCSNTSHHVIGLRISAGDGWPRRTGILSDALLDLHHLQILILRHVHLMEGKIPNFIGSLDKLEHFHLKWCGLSGVVPSQLGNLSKLKTLNLRGNIALKVNNLNWLYHLPLLSQLDLSDAKVGDPNWLHTISSLPSLKVLKCYSCILPQLTPSSVHLSSNSSFSSLATVDFASTNLTLPIFCWLGNLSSSLISLDLGGTFDLEKNNLDWLNQLRLLSQLDLSNTKVDDPNWLHAISRLPSLKELYLYSCDLPQLTPSTMHYSVNSSFPPLAIVDFSYSKLNSLIFSWLLNVSLSLVSIDLSSSELDGRIPEELGNNILLEHLDMSQNRLEGEIPYSFCNLIHLKHLDMSYNRLEGEILNPFGNFVPFEYLDMSHNMLEGEIPNFFGNFNLLKTLDMSYNRLAGEIPNSFGNLFLLEYLDISNNRLEGEIPNSFGNLFLLQHLDMSNNRLAGGIPNSFVNLSTWNFLDLSNNVGLQFQKWIQNQSNISDLDLTNNEISGYIPRSLWDTSPRLEYLNLSNNQLSGIIPDLSSNFVGFPIIDLSFNKFSGLLPLFHPNSSVLQLSTNMLTGPISSICTFKTLVMLVLSNNRFSDQLPQCLMNLSMLTILDIANNTFYGSILNGLFEHQSLEVLILRNNNMSGDLSLNLIDGFYLSIIDFGGNQFTGNIPAWIGGLATNLKVLVLGDNKFHGMIPLELCYLTQIRILDLSKNNMRGRIPSCFSNFTSLAQPNEAFKTLTMPWDVWGDRLNFKSEWYIENAFVSWKGMHREYSQNVRFLKLIDLSDNKLVGNIPKEIFLLKELISLNLSINHLTGSIDSSIGQMKQLESLDLSGNHLFGEIPLGLAHLSSLSVLDLSNNNLSGSIPLGTQLQGFNASSYTGNNKLCGPPLAPCPRLSGPHISLAENEEHVYYLDKGFYICGATGFVSGFWGVIVVVFFYTSWWRNHAMIKCWSKVWDWVYVRAVIHTNRRMR